MHLRVGTQLAVASIHVWIPTLGKDPIRFGLDEYEKFCGFSAELIEKVTVKFNHDKIAELTGWHHRGNGKNAHFIFGPPDTPHIMQFKTIGVVRKKLILEVVGYASQLA